jgi:hypothetical protein
MCLVFPVSHVQATADPFLGNGEMLWVTSGHHIIHALNAFAK